MQRTRIKTTIQTDIPESRPATNPDARQNQLISLAVDLAEKQLREGTASSQVITHFLKLATEKEKVELEKIEMEKQLLNARIKNLEAAERTEARYEEAIRAMRSYQGIKDEEMPE